MQLSGIRSTEEDEEDTIASYGEEGVVWLGRTSRDWTRVLSGLDDMETPHSRGRIRHTGLPLVLADSGSSHTIVTHAHPSIAASLRPLTPLSYTTTHPTIS